MTQKYMFGRQILLNCRRLWPWTWSSTCHPSTTLACLKVNVFTAVAIGHTCKTRWHDLFLNPEPGHRSQSAWRCAEAEVERDCLRCELFVSGFLAHTVRGLHAFASLMSGKVLVVLSTVLISYLFWIVLYLHLLPGSSGCLSILDSRLTGVLFCRWVRAPTFASKWYLHNMSMGEGRMGKDKWQTWGCDGYKALFPHGILGFSSLLCFF